MAEEEVRVGRRCFVSNLAWKTSWQDLKDKFRDCGNVVYTNVMRDENGRSKGWGIVEFERPEEAVAAINSLNGVDLGGRPLIVREDREDRDVKMLGQGGFDARGKGRGGRGGGRGRGRGDSESGEVAPPGTQVVVHGLPWSYTGDDLRGIFQGCGEIVQGDVVYGYDGRSRGYGVIQFASPEQANAAIGQFNGAELEGRTLSVKPDSYA